MKTLLVLALFFLFLPLKGQLFEGRISTNNNEPVAFANIGILNMNVGTVSNEKGLFILAFQEQDHLNDTLVISYVGYQSIKHAVPDFTQKLKSGDNRFVMQPKVEKLREVTVKPGQFAQRQLGNKTTAKRILAGWSHNNSGYEFGTLMKIKNAPSRIDSVTFNIPHCNYDSVFYRLNIYKIKGNSPGENILNSPIYLKYSRDDFQGLVTIDLTGRNIWVYNNFVVTLELVTELGEGGLYFSGTFLSSPTYYRKTSQGKWEKSKAGIGLSAWVTCQK